MSSGNANSTFKKYKSLAQFNSNLQVDSEHRPYEDWNNHFQRKSTNNLSAKPTPSKPKESEKTLTKFSKDDSSSSFKAKMCPMILDYLFKINTELLLLIKDNETNCK